VVTERTSPVSAFFIVTVAPLIAAPVESVTVPRIVPRNVCAPAPLATTNSNTAKASARTGRTLQISPAIADFIAAAATRQLHFTQFDFMLFPPGISRGISPEETPPWHSFVTFTLPALAHTRQASCATTVF
jgi:hypothetical protein